MFAGEGEGSVRGEVRAGGVGWAGENRRKRGIRGQEEVGTPVRVPSTPHLGVRHLLLQKWILSAMPVRNLMLD